MTKEDFDGDEMNLALLLDDFVSESFDALLPHTNMIELNGHRKLNSTANIPKPLASTIGNWRDKEEAIDPIKLQKMDALL
jgi:hypothetical protein